MSKKLIYVEDAIKEIIKKLGIKDESYLTAQEKAVTQVLKDMPSAQPECKRECMPMYADVSDCISRQDAIDALGEKPLVWDDLSDFDLGKATQWSDDVDAIKALPSAKPQRIKGKWVRKESELTWWYECSKCGESPLFDPYEHEVRTPFCPWCGARMEEEEDETD